MQILYGTPIVRQLSFASANDVKRYVAYLKGGSILQDLKKSKTRITESYKNSTMDDY